MLKLRPGINRILELLRLRWRQFLLIHLLATAVSVLVLTPVYTLLSGWLILASGSAALTDQDILFFVLSPTGFGVFLVIAALSATFLVFESALLFMAGLSAQRGLAPSLAALLRYVVARFAPLFRLAVHMVLRMALVALPFLAAGGWVFLRYLTDYDINFYLSQRPPVFYQAGAVIGLLLLVMAWLLARMLASWVVALPLLLLREGNPAAVLKTSRRAAAEARGPLTALFAAWLLGSAVLFAALAWVLDVLVGAALGLAGNSLETAAWLMAGLLLLWSLGNVLLGFVTGTVLVLGIVLIFERVFPGSGAGILERLAAGEGPPARSGRRTGLVVSVALVVLLVGAGYTLRVLEERLANETLPQVMAHRGASQEAPENTLAAVRLAIEQGADWVEIDVQETASGAILVIHDSDLMKVAGVPLKVATAPLEELQAVDIGSWKDPRYADQRIPTLQQVLELARDRIRVNIELKYYGQEQRLEERVASIVEQAGMQDQVVLMSLSYPGVRAMRALRPGWPVGLLSSVSLGDVTRLEADFFAINAKFANRAFVRAAHRRGKQVYAWTVNDPVLMSAMTSRGVDAIITDRPGLARDVFAQRAELETTEKLLLMLAGLMGSEVSEQ